MSTFSLVAIVLTVLSSRPGPPNKGVVSWSVGGFGPVTTVEVETSGLVTDPMSGQTWTHVPSFMDWSTAHLVKGGSAGSELRLDCPPDSGRPCTFWVVIYNCIPCSTENNGGIPATLMSLGWKAGSCGPRYVPFGGVGGEEYPTATFKYEMAAGEPPVLIPLTKDAFHIVVFELSMAQQCSLVEGSSSCMSREGCTMVEGSCVDKPLCSSSKGPQIPGQPKVCQCIPLPGQE